MNGSLKMSITHMQRVLLKLSIIGVGVFSLLGNAASTSPIKPTGPCAQVQDRPCIALVLGGGGARGGAHVGVLKELERRRIPIDMVIGTSIGAYVGGLYALGHSPAQIEQIMIQTPWGQGFRDRVARDEMPMRRKQQRDDFPINLDLGLDASGLKLPKGVLHGQAMAALIQQNYGSVAEFTSFDDLLIPFRAIATDLVNRQAVVLHRGSLQQAVQASMSIPGVVRPLEIDGRLLVDGGVANNLPIDIAKALGAERVIAVAIDSPLLEQRQLNSAMAITEQLTNFLVQEAVQRQMQLLQTQDVLLQPRMANIGTLDFDKVQLAIQIGEQAALDAVALDSMQVSAQVYAHWQYQRKRHSEEPVQLAGISLDNRTPYADDVILQRLDLTSEQPVKSQEINSALRRVYGMDTLERISSSIVRLPDGEQVLKLTAIPKSWGPAFLNFRFQLEDDFHNTHNYQIAASYLWTGLSAYGAEWQTDVAIGTDKLLQTEFYWPYADSGFYSTAQLKQSRTLLGLENSAGLSEGELNNTELQWRAEFGYYPTDAMNISVGMLHRDGYYRFPAAFAQQNQIERLSYLRRGVEMRWAMDSLDHVSFPTRGIKTELTLQRTQNNALGTRDFSDSTLFRAESARQFGEHIWRLRLRWDHFHGDTERVALEQFTLGGLLNLSGYPKNYLFGSEVRFGSLVYLYQLNDSRLSFFNAPYYVGWSLERGMVSQPRFADRSLLHRDDWIWAGSVFVGWDSPFGPLYLGYGQAEHGIQAQPYRFYLSLGQSF